MGVTKKKKSQIEELWTYVLSRRKTILHVEASEQRLPVYLVMILLVDVHNEPFIIMPSVRWKFDSFADENDKCRHCSHIVNSNTNTFKELIAMKSDT